ncbi:family 78 glycoside hydrolase catalytic domain [Paludicola sp. MB14-C6]|uniref:alpha-L-rhamnosidase n=1 Tax=Paludihabitans sp. MB14-C6 TaxID=3070656 RepID=UPI0027DC40DA|nr:alpha-L-rhamnosidase [Paludicola sp. MB14-C6]WMJ23181.1 family 78 glycoside hydrolase catalytic domain [Paludicola sp. MB14-C6]
MIQQAKWITCGSDCEAPVIKKTIVLDNPLSGEIDITGLGYFELYMNGRRVSDDYLVPALSDYQKRSLSKLTYPISDTFTHRIYYMNYDLTSYLCDGENVLEIMLGNGWYRQYERVAEGELSFGDELKALFSATFLSHSGSKVVVNSDGSETYTPSFIIYSNIFIGEVQDARLTNDETVTSHKVTVLPDPDAQLMLQTCPPDRIVRTIVPKLIKSTASLKIYDAGENISGWVRVKATGKEGDHIKLRFSEEIDENGMLDFSSSGVNQIQTDTFICNGKPQVFQPKFVFHGFRYFDISGNSDDLLAAVVNSDVSITSEFDSDNIALNWLYDAYIRTQLANMHSGVPSDCPHRERLGYTGDGQITSDSAMLLLNSNTFYEKWIYDILDCQDVVSGHIQHTAPFMGGGGGPGGWGCAVVVVPYVHYRHFGDRDLLNYCYSYMKKWVNYMMDHSENYLVVREEDKGWCLGDWAAVDEISIPEPFVNSCYFIKSLLILVKISKILEKPDDTKSYIAYIAKVKEALVDNYFDDNTGSFCQGDQGADAYALDICLLDDNRTILNLVAKYEALGYFDTGFLGTDILIDVLFRYGHGTLAFNLLTSDKMGSYSWMKQHGATTLWEYFDGRCSHNHPMFGAPVRQLFYRFLGIQQIETSVAFKNVIISPVIPEGLNSACGKISTLHGDICVSWYKDDCDVNLEVKIPKNVNAIFSYKGKDIALHTGMNTVIFKK